MRFGLEKGGGLQPAAGLQTGLAAEPLDRGPIQIGPQAKARPPFAPTGLAAVIMTALLAAPFAVGQTKKWTPTRTPDGQSDIQGVWTYSTLTPLERPAELATKATLTPEEAAAFARQTIDRVSTDRRDGGGAADVGRSYNEFWRDRGNVVKTMRTSLIVDPPDGKIPTLTPDGQKREAARAEFARLHPADGPENRNTWERCLGRGLPLVPSSYNNNFQIMQTPGYVVILLEMVHDARIIPLDGSPHVPSNVRSWLGDSRGHWEGNTLVVDVTNFTEGANFRGSDVNLHLVERFTRMDAETLLYEFTVDDPTTFTKPWTASIPANATSDKLFEYACNEGNFAMSGILGGARAEEKEAR